MDNKDLLGPVEEPFVHLLQIFDSIIPSRSAVYVSTPITTGEIFIDWYSRIGKNHHFDSKEYKMLLNSSVINTNSKIAKDKIGTIREKLKTIVIDPTTLVIDTWSQADYHHFWKLVIRKYIVKMIMLNGWQYSNGCSIEYVEAYNNGIEIYDENYNIISKEKAILLLKDGLEKMSNLPNSKTILLDSYNTLINT